MTKNITLPTIGQKLSWMFRPEPEHVVQFYQSEGELLTPLIEYISSGLIAGDSCIAIATTAHLRSLNEQLVKSGLDISRARQTGQFTTLDAAKTLDGFMINGMPDRDRFFKTVGRVVEKLTAKGKPIRAYGEMVALLWKTGNKEAVIMLENLWNELAEKYDFSLFCGYPQLHFIMDRDARDEITDCHSVTLHSLAAW